MSLQELIHKANAVRQLQLLIKAGGKPAQEGEVRTRADGTKWRKTGKTWTQVTDKKQKKEEPIKQGPKSKKVEQTNQKQTKQEEQVQVSKHDKAQLSHMKSILESDRTKAYEIYQSLSPEAQEHVPQSIVDKLVEHSNQPEVDVTVVKEYEAFDSMMNIQNGKETLFNEALALGWFEGMKQDYDYLTPEHLDALEVYGGSGYEEMNGFLRGSVKLGEDALYIGDDGEEYTFQEMIQKKIDTITEAINKSPGLKQNTVTHRGVQLIDQQVADFFNSLQIGDVYSDSAFHSTSLNKNVADKEFKKNLDVERGLTIKILLPKGTKAMSLLSTKMSDVNKNEYEVLLNRDTQFEVVERTPGQMTVIVK